MLKAPAAKSFGASPLQAAALRAKIVGMRVPGANAALNQRFYLRSMLGQAKFEQSSGGRSTRAAKV